MSLRVNRNGARVCSGEKLPWELPFNGRVWQDMPGATVDDKKMNFFFWRRGTLDVEEETQLAALADDGIVEVGEKKRPRLVARVQKRFGWSNWAKEPKKAEDELKPRKKELSAEELRVRAKLRLRIQAFYAAVKRGGARALCEDTGISVDSMKRIVHDGIGLTEERQVKIAKVLDVLEQDLDAVRARTTVKLQGRKKRGHQPPPEGYITLKEWAYAKAAELGCSRSAIHMQLVRGALAYPPGQRINSRSYWVRVDGKEVAA